MQHMKAKLVRALLAHFSEDDRRVEHALRVMGWTEELLKSEQADREIVLAVALLHDVGIKEAEARQGTSSARLQEKYGPEVARRLLQDAGFPADKIDAVCAIVGKHHTRRGIDSPEFRVLWDADLLVNTMDADNIDRGKMAARLDTVFATDTGRALARELFQG